MVTKRPALTCLIGFDFGNGLGKATRIDRTAQ